MLQETDILNALPSLPRADQTLGCLQRGIKKTEKFAGSQETRGQCHKLGKDKHSSAVLFLLASEKHKGRESIFFLKQGLQEEGGERMKNKFCITKETS